MNIKALPSMLILLLLHLVFSSLAVWSQSSRASIEAEFYVEDKTFLPGITVTLISETLSKVAVTDMNGQVKFTDLEPGFYEIRAVFAGFRTIVRPNVHVEKATPTQLKFMMVPASQECLPFGCLIQPLLFREQVSIHTPLEADELTMFPHARDPWAILETIPGIQTDRINVGGNESGQHSFFVGKGDDGTNTEWVINDIEITDHVAEGMSLSFLDFGSFQQMDITTGAHSVSSGASGPVVAFETKKGTNEHHGSIRLLFADQDFQSTNLQNGQVGNKVIESFEKGFEIGGPLLIDHLWYWGAFHQNTISNQVVSGENDRTRLENLSFRLHGNISQLTRLEAFYTRGDRQKDNLGAGNTRAPETTWNQQGPTPIYKFAISHLIGNSTELQLIYGKVDGGFSLSPQVSPDNAQPVFNAAQNRWENSYRDLDFSRNSRQYQLQGDTYLGLGNTENEFNYGFQYKHAWAISNETWGRDGTNLWVSDYSGVGATSYFFAHRDRLQGTELDSTSLWLEDMMTIGNLTMHFGLRYNHSDSSNLPSSSVAANPLFPVAMPALAYQGDDPKFEYKTFSPRIGATYSFGEVDQFLVRGNYRKYFDNISVNEAASINPAGRAWITGYAQDYDGNGQYDETELGFARDENGNVIPYRGNESTQDPYRFRPVGINPNSIPISINRMQIDPSLEPPEVDEFIFGGSWSLEPYFLFSANYTYRQRSNLHWNLTPLGNGRLLSRDDYELAHTLTGTNPVTDETYSVAYYTLSEEAANLRNFFGGSYLTNRPDYSQDYQSLELTATKLLSNRWMMRGYITFQDWTLDVGHNGVLNPTPNSTRSNVDGANVAIASNGSGNKTDVFPGTATWTAGLSGLYQFPWDIAVSGVFSAREGYLAPLFNNTRGFLDGSGRRSNINYSLGPLDSYRFDDVYNLNLKLSKTMRMGKTQVDLAVEVFNVFNENTVLQRDRRVGIHTSDGNRNQNFDDPNIGTQLGTFGRVNEYLSPRLARFSVIINF